MASEDTEIEAKSNRQLTVTVTGNLLNTKVLTQLNFLGGKRYVYACV
jgi:hypothetical protein